MLNTVLQTERKRHYEVRRKYHKLEKSLIRGKMPTNSECSNTVNSMWKSFMSLLWRLNTYIITPLTLGDSQFEKRSNVTSEI